MHENGYIATKKAVKSGLRPRAGCLCLGAGGMADKAQTSQNKKKNLQILH